MGEPKPIGLRLIKIGGNELITINEVREQPKILAEVAKNYEEIVRRTREIIQKANISQIDFVGCGSSYYLSMGLSMQARRMSGGKVKSRFLSGSEVMLGLADVVPGSVVVGISRSGESSETVAAIKAANMGGALTVAVTCSEESSISRFASVSLEIGFVKEEAIVMTKSFTSMSFLMSALCRDLFTHELLDRYLEVIPSISQEIIANANFELELIKAGTFTHYAFLGYDEYFAACMEGVIKVTEISLSDVDCYQTLEFRHGPKSKIGQQSLAVVSTNPKAYDQELKVAHDIMRLGGTVLYIHSGPSRNEHSISTGYPQKDFGDWFLRAMPFQLIGIKRALIKGVDPDSPNNLTRVVEI